MIPLKEKDRRRDPDADAKGIPVLLAGERWYIRPLGLGERGSKVALDLDGIQSQMPRMAAAQRRVAIAERAIAAAETEEALDAAEDALRRALEAQDAVVRDLGSLQASAAYNALMALYDVTEDEAGSLVTEREWPNVERAILGDDSRETEEDRVVALLKRLNDKEGGSASTEDPLRTSRFGAGAAASS